MTDIPTIDYTNKDYDSLRRAMLNLARYRLPEWTDQTASDMGVLMVDLFAYMGDVILYYQDRIANENFLHTAVERRSLMHLLRLIGYELRPPVSAGADMLLTFQLPSAGSTVVTIPKGTQFRSTVPADAPQTFEYLGPDLTIDLASDQVQPGSPGQVCYSGLPVWHSLSIPTEVISSSTGEPNQSFALSKTPVILDTLIVEVDEGAGWVKWNRRESLLYNLTRDGRVTLSSPDARDYYVQYNENGEAFVIFGDGVYGRRPPVGTSNIRATYSVGGGVIGNVPSGSITEAVTSIANLDLVTNPKAAAGGEDAESDEHAKQFGPLAFRSGQRAVTLEDYMALAHQAGGIAKVFARSLNWNTVELYVVPEGETCRKVPEGLRRRLTSYFEDKRMAGTFVRILDPKCVIIDIGLEIVADAHYQPDAVKQAALDAVTDMLAIKKVDFGHSLFQSDLYAVLDAIPGILAVSITKFQRQDAPATSFDEKLKQHNLPSLSELPEFLKRAIRVEVATDGRIELEDFEIPVAGKIEVSIKVAAK